MLFEELRQASKKNENWSLYYADRELFQEFYLGVIYSMPTIMNFGISRKKNQVQQQ